MRYRACVRWLLKGHKKITINRVLNLHSHLDNKTRFRILREEAARQEHMLECLVTYAIETSGESVEEQIFRSKANVLLWKEGYERKIKIALNTLYGTMHKPVADQS